MCKNVVEKANLSSPIIIYDIDKARAQEVEAKIGHATVASSIAEAASMADIIFYTVPDDAVVQSVLNEILTVDIKGKLIVDCSTVHPDTTLQEAKAVQSNGGSFVACPVFGATALAEAGQLVCVIAGEASAVEKVKPFCKGVMGRENIDLSGEEPGKATLMKLVGNTFVLNMVEALSEGHVLADKSGLGNRQLHRFIEILFPGPYTAYSTRMLSGDYHRCQQPLFAAGLARKDARHVQSIAHKADMKMNNVELADRYLRVVQEQRGPKGELAAIYGAKRLESGLPFEN